MDKLLNIAKRKNKIDFKSEWFEESAYYMRELISEIHEVEEELDAQDDAALEEELGDVLWDYLNLIQCIEKDRKISLDGIIRKCEQKYEERISALEQGMSWQEIKAIQRSRK